MKRLLAIAILLISLSSSSFAQCSERSVEKLISRLNKAYTALDKLNAKVDSLEIQREKLDNQRQTKLDYLNDQRTQYLFERDNVSLVFNCFSYPAQCATQISNLNQALLKTNTAIQKITRTFDKKLEKLDRTIYRYATVTIPAKEVAIASLEAKIEACN